MSSKEKGKRSGGEKKLKKITLKATNFLASSLAPEPGVKQLPQDCCAGSQGGVRSEALQGKVPEESVRGSSTTLPGIEDS